MATLGGKKLNQLRVVDLRAELGKRNLDKSGLKAILIKRLEKSLLEETSSEVNYKSNFDSPKMDDVQHGEVSTQKNVAASSSRYCICECSKLTAEVEGVKLDMTILESRVNHQMQANKDEISNLRKEVLILRAAIAECQQSTQKRKDEANSTEFEDRLRSEGDKLSESIHSLKEILEQQKHEFGKVEKIYANLEAANLTKQNLVNKRFPTGENCIEIIDDNVKCNREAQTDGSPQDKENEELTNTNANGKTNDRRQQQPLGKKKKKKKKNALNIAVEEKDKCLEDHTSISPPEPPASEDQGNQSVTSKRLVFVAGDSIIQHVHGWELSDSQTHVAVKSFSGAKTEDMEDYLKPLIRKEPDELIIHIGTNNIKGNETPRMVAEHVVNLGLQIQQNSPKTKVTVSELTVRKDKPEILNKIKDTNTLLKSFCAQKKWAFLNNKNIDSSCLNRRGLHLNRKGSNILSRNIMNHLSN